MKCALRGIYTLLQLRTYVASKLCEAFSEQGEFQHFAAKLFICKPILYY